MKTILIYISIINFLAILGCSQPVPDKPVERSHTIAYTNDANFGSNGYPVDSPYYYFPKSIFTDTIDCFVDPRTGFTYSTLYTSKRYISSVSDIPVENLKDTYCIEVDSSYFQYTSEILYRMGEPSLSSHYLGKDVYRLIALRSFHNPIVIRVEKRDGKMFVHSKELYINVHYKRVKSTFRFDLAYADDTSEPIDESIYPDSINVYDHVTFELEHDKSFLYEEPLWDDLEAVIDSSDFWRSKTLLYLNYVQMDGSKWFLEGHTQQGYQVRRIPSPGFADGNEPNDDDTDYTKIFKRIIGYSDLKDVELY